MPFIIANTPAEMLAALKEFELKEPEPEAPGPEAPEPEPEAPEAQCPSTENSDRHTPILLLEDLVSNPGVYGARCPTCKNVDIKFQARGFREKSSFKILIQYAGSGVDLQCLCCNTSFKFCGDRGFFGNYKLMNHVWVTQEWAIANLGIGE